MSRLRNENYIVIHGWMMNVLKLEKQELMVFAVIHGFSQVEGHRFTGTLDYLCEWCSICKATAVKLLASLVEKNYVTKYEILNGNAKYCQYEYNRELVDEMVSNYNRAILETKMGNESAILENKMGAILETKMPILENKMGAILETKTYNKIYNNKNNIINKNNKYIRNDETSSQDLGNFSSVNLSSSSLGITENITSEIDSKQKMGASAAAPRSVGDLFGEKLANIDNEKVREKRLANANKEEMTVEERKQRKIQKSLYKVSTTRTANTELLKVLDDYVSMFQTSYFNLSKETWTAKLDELFKLDANEEKLVQYVKIAIQNGWKNFYLPRAVGRSFDNTRNHVYDTRALHEFSKEEMQEFEGRLAKNADGSFMTF